MKKQKIQRPRDVGLYGGDSQKLRLFRDGGFELCSEESRCKSKRDLRSCRFAMTHHDNKLETS